MILREGFLLYCRILLASMKTLKPIVYRLKDVSCSHGGSTMKGIFPELGL